MRYLLDTNIISDFMRRPQGSVALKIEAVGADAVFTSVAAAELRFGLRRNSSPRLAERLRLTLETMTIAPFDAPAAIVYGDIRHALESRGTPIGGNDVLIAAHCLALGAVMVTDNLREFTRVPELLVENWLTRSPN